MKECMGGNENARALTTDATRERTTRVGFTKRPADELQRGAEK